MRSRDRAIRHRELVLRFTAVGIGATAPVAQTPALNNPFEIYAIRAASSVSNNNNLIRLQYVYQAGEQIQSAAGAASTIAGKDGIGGYVEPPIWVSKGVQLNVTVTNDEPATIANITIVFLVKEHYRVRRSQE